MLKEIESLKHFIEIIESLKRSYILIYKKGSEASDCSYSNIELIKNNEIVVFSVDVNIIKNIHIKYNVSSAPSLLYFEKTELKNIIKGCMSKDYYESLFNNVIFTSSDNKKVVKKRVIVYTSPSCSWCTTTKNYLKNNNIAFKEIDISKNQKAAEDLVRRSGKQGVPQTDINGQIVVGFDKNKFDSLLA